MFGNIFKHSFKILIRDKTAIFWTVVFVVLLSLMFKVTFSKLDEIDKFEAIPISVNKEVLKDEYFTNFLKIMEKEDYIKLIDAGDMDQKELFKKQKIVAYIEDEKNIIVNKGASRTNETIIKALMESYIQNKSMIINVLKENPYANINELLSFKTFIKDESKNNISLINTYFYTLIGMQVLYSYMWGIKVMYMYEANLSTQGKRITISPVKKKKSILASLLAAWAISVLLNLFCVTFISQVINVNIGPKIAEILLIILVGTLTGVSFGTLIAVSSKKSNEFKNGLGVSITMLWSFLGGMMMSDMKVLIAKNAPLLGKLNPVTLITDALYSLAINSEMIRFYNNIMYLLIISIIFIIGTMFFVRGKKYESL